MIPTAREIIVIVCTIIHGVSDIISVTPHAILTVYLPTYQSANPTNGNCIPLNALNASCVIS